MTTIGSILMGALQGITEFLPVSSSAHLIVVPWIFKMNEGNVDPLIFDVMLHFGTAFALLAVYLGKIVYTCRDDYIALKHGNIRDSLILKIAVGTIPAALLGVVFKDFIENQLRSPVIIVFSLIGVSVLMFIAERLNLRNRKITYPLALLIGTAQAIALVPGVSRSGITITCAMLLGLKRSEAVDFTFLLSIPIVFGVSFFEARHLSFIYGDEATVYLVGAFSAFIFGVVGLKFLINYLKRHTLDVFAYYRVGLALLIVGFLFAR